MPSCSLSLSRNLAYPPEPAACAATQVSSPPDHPGRPPSSSQKHAKLRRTSPTTSCRFAATSPSSSRESQAVLEEQPSGHRRSSLSIPPCTVGSSSISFLRVSFTSSRIHLKWSAVIRSSSTLEWPWHRRDPLPVAFVRPSQLTEPHGEPLALFSRPERSSPLAGALRASQAWLRCPVAAVEPRHGMRRGHGDRAWPASRTRACMGRLEASQACWALTAELAAVCTAQVGVIPFPFVQLKKINSRNYPKLGKFISFKI